MSPEDQPKDISSIKTKTEAMTEPNFQSNPQNAQSQTSSSLKVGSFRHRLYVIIFEHDTLGGRLFDMALLLFIVASVISVSLESIAEFHAEHLLLFRVSEWFFTILFTIEYLCRIYCSPNRLKYLFSFFGLIDFLSVLPTYVEPFIGGAHYLMVVRILRLLRIFRVLKLTRFLTEADELKTALLAARAKITVFLGVVLSSVVIIGAVMYLVEGPQHGFTSIPRSVYWAIVTLTTVGYGDIAPRTPLGQFLACAVMVFGYGIIAVPTGIVSVELNQASSRKASKASLSCANCNCKNHESDSRYCRLCGTELS